MSESKSTTHQVSLQARAGRPSVSINAVRVKPEFQLFGHPGIKALGEIGATLDPDHDMTWQQAFMELGRERAKSELLEKDLVAARSVIADLRGQNEEKERRLLDAERITSRLDEELDTLRDQLHRREGGRS